MGVIMIGPEIDQPKVICQIKLRKLRIIDGRENFEPCFPLHFQKYSYIVIATSGFYLLGHVKCSQFGGKVFSNSGKYAK